MEQPRIVRLPFLVFQLLSLALLNAVAQSPHAQSRSGDSLSPTEAIHSLSQLADEAHQSGDIGKEIEYRRDLSRLAWDHFARHRNLRACGIAGSL